MSDQDLADALGQYRAGLEAEIALLHQLEASAARQRGVTESREFERFAAESDEREQLTRSLVAIEDSQQAARGLLRARRAEAERLPGYAAVIELRHQAAALVTRILSTDRESIRALSDAELARRAAVASLERGETTLAAYRKVLTPTMAGASLVNLRG